MIVYCDRAIFSRHCVACVVLSASPQNHGTLGQSDIIRAILVLQAALVDLAELINASLEADSELGDELSERERHRIFEEIEGLEHEAEKLKRLISR